MGTSTERSSYCGARAGRKQKVRSDQRAGSILLWSCIAPPCANRSEHLHDRCLSSEMPLNGYGRRKLRMLQAALGTVDIGTIAHPAKNSLK
jgi:hypothetical protein